MRFFYRKSILCILALFAVLVAAVLFFTKPSPIDIAFSRYLAPTYFGANSDQYSAPIPLDRRIALFDLTNRSTLHLRHVGTVIEIHSPDGWVREQQQPVLIQFGGPTWWNVSNGGESFMIAEPPGTNSWRAVLSFSDIRHVDGNGLLGLLRRIPVYRLLPKIKGVSPEVAR